MDNTLPGTCVLYVPLSLSFASPMLISDVRTSLWIVSPLTCSSNLKKVLQTGVPFCVLVSSDNECICKWSENNVLAHPWDNIPYHIVDFCNKWLNSAFNGKFSRPTTSFTQNKNLVQYSKSCTKIRLIGIVGVKMISWTDWYI